MTYDTTRFHTILRYGPFSFSTMTTGFKEEMRIPKPIGDISMQSYNKDEPPKIDTYSPKGVLVFRYKGRLASDVIEYVFSREEL